MTDHSEASEKPKRKPGRPPKQKVAFEWISNDNPKHPYVTIDKQQRLYISAPARELIGLPKGRFHLIAGYDSVNKRIVLAKPDIVRVTDVKPFKFDKRSYSNAKPFVEQAKLGGKLPVRFAYSGKEYAEFPDGSFVFTLEGIKSPDERGR